MVVVMSFDWSVIRCFHCWEQQHFAQPLTICFWPHSSARAVGAVRAVRASAYLACLCLLRYVCCSVSEYSADQATLSLSVCVKTINVPKIIFAVNKKSRFVLRILYSSEIVQCCDWWYCATITHCRHGLLNEK